MLPNYHTEFLTGTIINWNRLLKEDIYKQIIVDSFQWLVKEKKCIINAFVIMPKIGAVGVQSTAAGSEPLDSTIVQAAEEGNQIKSFIVLSLAQYKHVSLTSTARYRTILFC